jgi:hypothetical protein
MFRPEFVFQHNFHQFSDLPAAAAEQCKIAIVKISKAAFNCSTVRRSQGK